MPNIMIAGCGTDVGKTVVSAIIVDSLKADYWKPIQTGVESDSKFIAQVVDGKGCHIHRPAYSFPEPLSPHHAARLNGCKIDPSGIHLPKTSKNLVIEGIGGVLVPLTDTQLTLDLFESWPCQWIVVSRHYIGSINHTLLTIRELLRRGINPCGLIFNGLPNADSENAICCLTNLPIIGHLLPETSIDSAVIKKYSKLWKQNLLKAIQ